MSAYQYGIEIPQNSDLDTYKTPGKYVSHSSSVTSTIENSPFSSGGFRLEVRSMIDPNNGASIQQIAYPGNMNAFKQFAIRTFLNTAWDDWRYFSDDATVILAAQNTTPPYKIFSSSSNEQEVDEYLEDYSQPYASHTHYYIAMNLAFVHSTLGGGDMLIEGYKANENYEWQKATKYDSSGIVSFARSKMNQIWTDWNSKNIS